MGSLTPEPQTSFCVPKKNKNEPLLQRLPARYLDGNEGNLLDTDRSACQPVPRAVSQKSEQVVSREAGV